jgi:hypothetical protein
MRAVALIDTSAVQLSEPFHNRNRGGLGAQRLPSMLSQHAIAALVIAAGPTLAAWLLVVT